MQYVYNPLCIKFRKCDDDGTTLVCLSDTNGQLVLNRIGSEILDYLPQYTTTEELLDRLHQEYPDIDIQTLESDLFQILWPMEAYSILDINSTVSIENAENSGAKYYVAGDSNYKELSKFITSALSQNSLSLSQNISSEFYSPMALRVRVIQNLEYMAFASKGGNILGAIAIGVPQNFTTQVLNINALFFKDGLTVEEMAVLLQGMISTLIEIFSSKIRVKKVRTMVCDNMAHQALLEILHKSKFKNEFCLEDETSIGDGKITAHTLFLN